MTSALVTSICKKAQVTQMIQETPKVILDHVSYIHYPIQFQKNKKATIWALINFDSKVNVITPPYVAKLGLKVCPTNIRA